MLGLEVKQVTAGNCVSQEILSRKLPKKWRKLTGEKRKFQFPGGTLPFGVGESDDVGNRSMPFGREATIQSYGIWLLDFGRAFR